MRTHIPTNHNFYEESPLAENDLKVKFGVRKKSQIKAIKDNLFASNFEFTTHNESLEQVQIFSFKEQRNKLNEEKRLILKLYSKETANTEKKYIIQTGLFAGVLYHKGCQFNITTPYGDVFLKRMLNFVNDIYVDNQEAKATKSDQPNEFQNIIAYLFIQSLEKASVLGLPKQYKLQTQRSHKVRGRIDINSYLKHDIPFKGKLTTSFREQVFTQEIVDVLFLACHKLEQNFGKEIHRKILGIYQQLKQNYSGNFVHRDTIEKAKNNSVLQNPMYAPFKNVLTYAEIILKEQDLLIQAENNNLSTHGYVFDISQLFEVYLEKLLNRHFSEWNVTGQEELNVYDGLFYGRKMFPDLVMRHSENNQIIVLDAKFKKMRMIKNDLDRSDFYQIHSYIQHYEPNVLFGGLIYPLSAELDTDKAHSKELYGNKDNSTGFIVDGIKVGETLSMAEIIAHEKEFLERMEYLIECSNNKKAKLEQA